MKHDWIKQRGRIYWYDQYAINEQETAFAKYDPDRIARELVETGVDIVAVYAANQSGIAYYPSEIWPQHPGLRGRDYVGDLTTRLHKAGKRVLLYTNWLDSKHPEWNIQCLGADHTAARKEQRLANWADTSKPNGRVQALPGGGWQQPCFNSPKREQMVALAREICDRYHPDAFHMDMFFMGGVCVCNFCRPSLEKICGTTDITMTAIQAHWPAYVDWRCARSASLIADISAVLRERGVVSAHNAFAPLYQSAAAGVDQGWLNSLDIYLSECFDVFLVSGSDLNTTSITVRWQHAIGKPSWMLLTSTPQHYAHTPVSQAKFVVYAAAAKANGAHFFGPCGVGARPDTTSSRVLLANVKKGFDVFMEDADLSVGATSAAQVALTFSWATRKYHEAKPGAQQWSDELNGWARLLIEEHIPFDIITAEDIVSSRALSKYRLVILPNTANLGEAFCSAVREYARKGGRLLATAESSLRNDKGAALPDFALGDVLGVSSKGRYEGHMAVQRADEPEPVSGLIQQVSAAGGVRAQYWSVDPAGSVAGAKDPLPVSATDWPAEVGHACGRGQSTYIGFDIGRYYTLHGDEHIGRWMADAIDGLLPDRQLRVKAPRTVEVTVWEQKRLKRVIVHLANRTVPWTLPTDARMMTEIVPVHDVEIRMNTPFPGAVATARHVRIRTRLHKEELVVKLAGLDAYAAILIEKA